MKFDFFVDIQLSETTATKILLCKAVDIKFS